MITVQVVFDVDADEGKESRDNNEVEDDME